jgi:hypothetical protein
MKLEDLQPLIDEIARQRALINNLVADRQPMRLQMTEALLEIERAKSQLSQPRDGRDGKDGADGKDGVGIAAVSRLPDDAMELEFTSGDRVKVELPRGIDGKDGADGKGADGKDGNPGERGERGLAGVGVDVPRYVPGVYRQGVMVQHFIGRTYEALCDTAEPPGDSAHWRRIGAGGQRWTGPKQKDRQYEVGDLFVDGGTFLCTAEGEYQLMAPKPLSPSDVRAIVKQCVTEARAEISEESNAHALGIQRQLAEHMSVINRVSQAQTHLGEQLSKGLEGVREWVPQWVRQWWQRDHGDER